MAAIKNEVSRKLVAQPDMTQKERERGIAMVGLSTIYANANTAMAFTRGTFDADEKMNTLAFSDVLEEKVNNVKSGDLSDMEATLVSQAVALDAIFNELAKRAANGILHLPTCEMFLRLAMKAQSQCRATIETLAEVKQPKSATFVKQQNVAYQQQVNNGENPASRKCENSPSHGKNKPNRKNELLENKNGAWLDGRATPATIDNDPQLETLGTINWSKNTRRKAAL
ncbi:MAG: hypothetical protein Q7T57_01655 [Dehalococcoidales bacterium]|nr:hypothetical protein [Dehalococcoidales bacterium]